jgi:hypothetical protein
VVLNDIVYDVYRASVDPVDQPKGPYGRSARE